MNQANLLGRFSRTNRVWWMYQPRLALACSDQLASPLPFYSNFQQTRIFLKYDERIIVSCGRTGDLTKLGLIWACTSITPCLSCSDDQADLLDPCSQRNWANLGQYINHPVFGSPLYRKLDRKTCLYTVLVMSRISKRKRNHPSILEFCWYWNETNPLISKIFWIEDKRRTLVQKMSGSKNN